MFLAGQAARQERLLENHASQETWSQAPQAKGISSDSGLSVHPWRGKNPFDHCLLYLWLSEFLRLLLTLKYWDIFIPTLLFKKKKKKGNIPLHPEYLSWWGTENGLSTSHFGIHCPLRRCRTHSRPRTGLEARRGIFWKMKSSWKCTDNPGEEFSRKGLNLLIFHVGWLSVKDAS